MPKQPLTEEEKQARKDAKLAKLAEEKEREHQEFLTERERFRNNAPYTALQLLARAEKIPSLAVHTKVVEDTFPDGDGPGRNYCKVLFWSGDSEFDTEFCVWEGVARTPEELNLRRWEFESVVREFEQYEEKVNEELERQRKRQELLQRLTPEEKELLGLHT